jgi:BSD domain
MGQVLETPEEGEEFPWFQILQWSTEEVPTSEMFVYDLQAVRKAIEKDWENETVFLAACPSGSETLELRCDDDSAEEVWLSWASSLLDKSPELSDLRFSLVPRKMPEELFWARVFTTAKYSVLSTISS